MHTDDRARFARIGLKGDAKLKGKTVSIAGLGSVGASVAVILGRENVDLRIIDMGRVEETDMHRLSVFYEEDITKFKIKQAKMRINAINPHVQVKSFHEELSDANMFLLQGDLIVDATNNPTINALSMEHALKTKTPLVLVRYSGSRAKILMQHKKLSANTLGKLDLPPIETEGIFSPVTTMAASIIVTEVLRCLMGEKANKLIEIDAWDAKIKLTKL